MGIGNKDNFDDIADIQQMGQGKQSSLKGFKNLFKKNSNEMMD